MLFGVCRNMLTVHTPEDDNILESRLEVNFPYQFPNACKACRCFSIAVFCSSVISLDALMSLSNGLTAHSASYFIHDCLKTCVGLLDDTDRVIYKPLVLDRGCNCWSGTRSRFCDGGIPNEDNEL